MDRPIAKRTALSSAVITSLTGGILLVKGKDRLLNLRIGNISRRLFTQVLPALAIVGLFSQSASAYLTFSQSNGQGSIVGKEVTSGTAYDSSTGTTTDKIRDEENSEWVYGIYTDGSVSSGADLTITGSTAIQRVYGITWASSGDVSNNKLTLTNTTVSGNAYGAHSSGSGDIYNNELHIIGSDGSSAGANVVYGSYASLSSSSGKVYGTTLSIEAYGGATVSVGSIYGARTDGLGAVTGNTVKIIGTGESTITVGTVEAGSAYNSDNGSEVSGNKVIIDGTGITGTGSITVGGNIFGGYSTGSGKISSNTVEISGSVDVSGHVVYGGYNGTNSSTSVFDGNGVTIDADDFKASSVYGADSSGTGSITNNTVSITGGSISVHSYDSSGNVSGGSISGGFSYALNGGVVSGNSVTIKEVDYLTTSSIYGGRSGGSGDVTGNTVSISGETIEISTYTTTDSTTGEEVEAGGVITAGFAASGGVVSGNKVEIDAKDVTATYIYGGRNGGTGAVTGNEVSINIRDGGKGNIGNIYGGFSDTDGAGDISGNTVTITGESIESNYIYGGRTQGAGSGSVTGNTVTINVTTIKTDSIATGDEEGHETGSAIYGGFAGNADSTGDVSGNTVTITGENVNIGFVYGGRNQGEGETAGDANNNSVAIEITGEGGEVDYIYGGFAVSGKASNNTTTVSGSGSESITQVYGGASGRIHSRNTAAVGSTITGAGAFNNTVTISGDNNKIESVYGGFAVGGEVSNNTVTITGNSASLSYVYGGYADEEEGALGNYSNGAVTGNKVTLSGSVQGTITGVYGGYSEGDGDISGNTVEITGTDAISDVYGGYSNGSGTVSGNTVTINGADTIEDVVGGYSASGNVTGNTVNIDGGDIDEDTQGFVYGGRSDGAGTVSSNTLNLNGGHIEGNLYAGASGEGGTVTGNRINVDGNSSYKVSGYDLDLSNATLYGTNLGNATGSDNNSLYIMNFTGKAINIVGFDVIDLDISGIDLANAEYGKGAILTLTADDATNLDNSTITIHSSDSSMGLSGVAITSSPLADKYTIIENASGALTADNASITESITVVQDSSLYSEYTLVEDHSDGTISYEVGEIKTTPLPGVIPDHHLGIASFLNAATDFVLDRKLECSANEDGSVGTCFYGAVSGGRLHYDLRGSAWARTFGTHWFLGVRNKFNKDDTSKDINGAIWAEAGWGTGKTTTSHAGAHGHNNYYGVGILAEHRQKEGSLAGAYAQVYAKIGNAGYNVKTSLSSGDSRLKYDKNSLYVGAGAQLGYEYPFNDKVSLDTSVSYRWLHLEGFKTTLNSTQYKVKDVESHRTRVGTRISYGTDRKFSTIYAGIAWEHEFSGKAKGTVAGIDMTGTSSLKGDSGVLEAGARFKPSKKSRWTIDGSMEAYFGKKEGLLGNLIVNYSF